MGFNVRRKIKLVFPEDHPLHGLEITLRTISLGKFREITEREDKVDYGEAEITVMIDHVVEWNLEDEDGNPLPISVESFMEIDPANSTAIRLAWFEKSMGQEVPVPLDEGSTSGSTTDHTLSSLAFAPTESLPTSPTS